MAEKFEVFRDPQLRQIVLKELTEVHSPFQFTMKAPGSCRWSIPPSQVGLPYSKPISLNHPILLEILDRFHLHRKNVIPSFQNGRGKERKADS